MNRKALTPLCLLLLCVCGDVCFGVISPKIKPWARLDGEAYNMRLSPSSKFIAYTDNHGFNLSVLDLAQKKAFRVTRMHTGGSFFFSPDGYRIFFRTLVSTKEGSVNSVISAFDVHSKAEVEISRLPSSSAYLTFDPRDMRFQLLYPKGILSKMIVFPDQRLAKWQAAQNTDEGKWLATPKGILWLTHSGFSMTKLDDDDSGLQSFDVSPDGTQCVWSTTSGEVYVSQLGQKPVRIAYGFDPKWHPAKPLIVLAGARRSGTKNVSTDIRIVDINGNGQWLTTEGATDERWPAWTQDGKSIVFSMAKTTDIYKIGLR